MQTIEYRFREDKKDWPEGPWQTEPDKKQWTDPDTGLPCLIVRNRSGALCGYVGVAESHPCFNMPYDNVYSISNEDYSESVDGPLPDLDVHGGLTYSDFCVEDGQEHGVCHLVEPGENDRIWWLGFDCAHFRDLCPAHQRWEQEHGFDSRDYDTYKDFAYVTHEVTQLAARLNQIADVTS